MEPYNTPDILQPAQNANQVLFLHEALTTELKGRLKRHLKVGQESNTRQATSGLSVTGAWLYNQGLHLWRTPILQASDCQWGVFHVVHSSNFYFLYIVL